MSKFEDQSKELKDLLGLNWSPIAVTYSDTPDERGDNGKYPGACKAIEKVLLDNAIINLSKENLLCIGAKHYLGLEKLPLSAGITIWTEYHNGYESEKAARNQFMKNPKPPGFWPWTKSLTKPFVILSPLEMTRSDPDTVLVFCNPEQADRLTGLIAYQGHKPMPLYPANSFCFSSVVPKVTGKTTISLISRHSREMFDLKIPSSELYVSMPYHELQNAVDNIDNSGYGRGKTKHLDIRTMNELVGIKPVDRTSK